VLHELEAAFLLDFWKLTYNQTILQVGRLGSENRFIKPEFRQNYVVVDELRPAEGEAANPTIQADPRDLPFATDSIDIVLIPHYLEFQTNPHAILQEVERILKPEGELYIFGFNPWRLRGLTIRSSAEDTPAIPNAVSSHRLGDWLSLLKLKVELLAGFFPASAETIARPSDLIGQSRAMFSTAYLLHGIKRTYTLIPVGPIWLRAASLLPRRAINTAVVRRSP
jgi:SAM-dependent methyltransferase